MPPLFYFKDGAELRGPFEENDVLAKYKMAEFSSDFEFQIRPSVDEQTPFITLRALLRENGHWNPFRNENEQIKKQIAEKQKQLDELSTQLASLLEKKDSIEGRIEQAERRIQEKLRQKREQEERKEEKKEEKEDKKVKEVKEEKFISFNDLPGMKEKGYVDVDRNSIDSIIPFHRCEVCKLVCTSSKQFFIHLHRSSCTVRGMRISGDKEEQERWKREDEQRIATGQRLYKKLSQDDIGCARPQINFIQELQQRICQKMKFRFNNLGYLAESDAKWIRSDEARKMSDRFVKHLEGAKGYLVCTRCAVACRTHLHFVKHLLTYDHRLKVKGLPMEQLTLLIGYFYKALYVEAPDPSELDEDLEIDGVGTPQAVKAQTSRPPAPPSQAEVPSLDSLIHEDNKEKENEVAKRKFLEEYSQKIAINCEHCDLIFSTYKQWLLHCTTEEHEAKAGTEESTRLEELFDEELQKWRWEDRVKLSNGKRMYEAMSEEEKEDAEPNDAYIFAVDRFFKNALLEWEDKRRGDSSLREQEKYEGLANIAVNMKDNMKFVEDRLNEAILRKFACHPCKVAFDEPDKYFTHCQMSKHLLNTASKQEKYLSMLISFHKKDLYFK